MEPATRAQHPVKHEAVDPVLEKLAETATFNCDWPTLRHHFYLALLAALPLFLERGPPVSLAGRIPVEPAAHSTPPRTGPGAGPSGGAGPGADNTLLSPGRGAGWNEDDGSRGITPPRDETTDASLRPSTQGGLVILPFPPLDTGRRRRSLDQPRVNGAPVAGRGNPFEDEWDEEVIIGGRKLPGWLDEEDGKKEVEKVAQRLEELTFAPFTVQRLAELVIDPTKLHASLGKFLRAVEKMLNVTTAYTPPSYTYVPPSGFAFEATGSSASPRSSAGSEDSTVPPGSMTPMFSPIPFLIGNHDDMLGDSMLDSDGGHEDSLMSPLMLESSGTFAVQQGDRARSPTPEPEQEPESAARAAAADSKSPTRTEASTSSAASSNGANPGHQPYLGRVDELDAGPVKSNGHAEDADGDAGMGEGGTMTPHTMSDRPVPISSTTVIAEDEREIAPLRRASVSHADAVDVDGAEEKKEAKENEEKEKAKEKEGEKANEGDAEMKEDGGGEGAEKTE